MYKLYSQLLNEVSGPPEADGSNNINVSSCFAFGTANRPGSGVGFHKIPCDKE